MMQCCQLIYVTVCFPLKRLPSIGEEIHIKEALGMGINIFLFIFISFESANAPFDSQHYFFLLDSMCSFSLWGLTSH